ncbi:PREDICTED: uncharacterized protein LOC104723963 [Camelina sativa]|uniref:Uncharacterized protein LOC104723963 n=1 Tax=Camelina sativa TaxID=90675 RepID=A0ABM0UG82_CAMSA|nr:PREDICTED: uncharacterized protein LOC104723963 [Camelina sativa]
MAAGSMDGIFRNIFEGCISSCDSSIQRRPYHKNCGCALHGGGSSIPCRHERSKIIVFPIQRSWSEGNSLALHLAPSSSSSNLQSLSSSSSISTLASFSSTVSDIDSPI